jgi:Nif-specific regulatory protein
MKKDRSAVELDILYHISQAMAHQHNVEAFLNEVLDILETEMGLSSGTLALRQADTGILAIAASRGLSAEEKKRGEYKLGEGITGKVAKTGKAALVEDISQDPSFLNRTKSRSNKRASFLCAPIVHQGQVIGTISIDRSMADRKELERDLEYLTLIANLIAESVFSIRQQKEEKEGLIAENKRLRQQLGDQYHPANIIGNCGSMRRVYDQISQVADSPATVLIRGASGTGKELVARAIHFCSTRKNSPFISVNCAALPENLVESELFGHEKGSFTGALSQRKGRFELANGGTLFLDEIGDIAPSVQVRLLRVLQEKEFERVGGDKTLSLNVRVITATSTDLEQLMAENKFRDDLFYRLNVFPIHLPPLRERRTDIMMLADHFVQKYSKLYSRNIQRISTAAINMMMAYHWPGNVRELENCIERAVLTTTDSVIHGYSLPPSLQTSDQTGTSTLPVEGANFKDLVENYEREIIIDALKRNRGNAAATARDLHTTQRIMNYKISNLAITPSNYKPGA